MSFENGWPVVPSAHSVEVYVDWMNLYLANLHVYGGQYNCGESLKNLWRLAVQLGSEPRRVFLYLNVQVFKAKHSVTWFKLLKSCRAMKINIVDVPLIDGKDQVDPWMIDVMLNRNRKAHPDISFLFVSADRGFEPMLTEIRQTRAIYIGLPTTPRIPLLSKATTGWSWVHPEAWQHIAVFDALNPDDVSPAGRINNLVEVNAEYCRGLAMSERCIAKIRQSTDFDSVDALRAAITEALVNFAWVPDHERNIDLFTGAMIRYQIVKRRGQALVINLDHRALAPRQKNRTSSDRRSAPWPG